MLFFGGSRERTHRARRGACPVKFVGGFLEVGRETTARRGDGGARHRTSRTAADAPGRPRAGCAAAAARSGQRRRYAPQRRARCTGTRAPRKVCGAVCGAAVGGHGVCDLRQHVPQSSRAGRGRGPHAHVPRAGPLGECTSSARATRAGAAGCVRDELRPFGSAPDCLRTDSLPR